MSADDHGRHHSAREKGMRAYEILQCTQKRGAAFCVTCACNKNDAE
jgi:hypothetical protein